MNKGQFKTIPVRERIWNRIKKTASCWLWTGAKDAKGYGHIHYNGRSRKAARVVYEMEVGPIRDGLLLLHSCDNPPCVNPAHLRPGTQSENMTECAERGRNKAYLLSKSSCLRGHPMSGENLYVDPRGRRVCRGCMRISDLAYKARRLAALGQENKING